jgi:hypothetical protein
MKMSPVSRISEDEASKIAIDARIMAIRWDVIEWAVVLDIDTPDSEAPGARMRRAWLVFTGVSDMTIPIRSARLPIGICLTSHIIADSEEDGFQTYTCHGLFPVFDGDIPRPGETANTMSIRAQSLFGVVSTDRAVTTQEGLDLNVRRKLASDDDMLQAARSA